MRPKTREAVERGIQAVKLAGKQIGRGAEKTASAAREVTEAASAARDGRVTAFGESVMRGAAQRAGQAARRAATETVKAAVAAARKALTKSGGLLVAAAGGVAAVFLIVVTCIAGMVAGSSLGVFFSNEDNGGVVTMQQATVEIQAEYNEKIAAIKRNNPHTAVVESGEPADWKEVIAVFAVKVASDPDNPQDVAVLDEGKKAVLRGVFWRMTELDYSIRVRQVDGVEVSRTLHIDVSHADAAWAANFYNFTAEQREALAMLLDPANERLWDVF